MLLNRVIPCLLLSGHGLVKTTRFSNPKYIGDPVNAIKIFNEKEVDELLVLDIDASKNKSEPNYSLIEEFAGECFMPLCYGGGIKNISQASQLFRLGVEKISIQSSAIEDISIITKIAEKFGSQSIVVSIDIKKTLFKSYKLYNASMEKTINKRMWTDYLKEVQNAGAGEVLINSVDRDGTMKGMDLDLIRSASQILDIPLISMGGIGSMDDIKSAIDAGANAVAAGSYFVFHGPHRAVLITYPQYNDIEKLLSVP